MIRGGIDPGAEGRRQKLESSTTLTFRDAVEEYIKKRVSTMRRRRDTEREIRRLAARWSRLSVTELDRSEVVKFMDKVGARNPGYGASPVWVSACVVQLASRARRHRDLAMQLALGAP